MSSATPESRGDLEPRPLAIVRSMSLRARATSLVAAVVLLSVGAGALGISFAVQSANNSSTELATLLPAAATVNQLLATTVDEETGERGYVITGEIKFLQPYSAGESEEPKIVAALRHELGGHTRALGQLAAVERRYASWINDYAQDQVNEVRAGNVAAAVAVEKSGLGKSYFDALRESISTLSAEITTEEDAAEAHIHNVQEATVWLVVTMTLALLAGAGVGLALVHRWIVQPIERLEGEVETVAGGAFNREVHPFGPREIYSLGNSVEEMRRRVRAEHDENAFLRGVAETLQRSLLPQVLPTPEGFEIRARYLAGVDGVEVGGDWYNVRIAGTHRSFFAVGDVSGRGLQAAALMASLRYAINAYAAEDPDPASVLNRLGRLSNIRDHGRFATVLCGLVDADAGSITLANAGHPSAVLIADDAAILVGAASGPPIGLGHDHYRAIEVPFSGAATLIGYTDGLVERRNESVAQGIERLRRVAEVDLPLDAFLDYLIATMVPQGAGDDVVVLGVRFAGPTGDGEDPTVTG